MAQKEPQPLQYFYNDVLTRNQQKTFRDKIIEATGVQKAAFYNWLNRNTEPNKAYQQIIVDTLNAHLPAKKMVMPKDIDFTRNVTSTPQTV